MPTFFPQQTKKDQKFKSVNGYKIFFKTAN